MANQSQRGGKGPKIRHKADMHLALQLLDCSHSLKITSKQSYVLYVLQAQLFAQLSAQCKEDYQ